MQTLINIDDKLLAEAAQLVTTQNQSQLIEIALIEFIKNHQSTPKEYILDLVGKMNRVTQKISMQKERISLMRKMERQLNGTSYEDSEEWIKAIKETRTFSKPKTVF